MSELPSRLLNEQERQWLARAMPALRKVVTAKAKQTVNEWKVCGDEHTRHELWHHVRAIERLPGWIDGELQPFKSDEGGSTS